MSKAKKASAPIGAKTSWKNAFKRDWQLYLMLLFPLAMVIIFNYASYPGLRMIFMDYKPAKGYSGSEWVGMKTILKVFKDADFHRALKSSIAFNLLDLVVGFPMPIILALMLNELRYPRNTDNPVSATLPFMGYRRQCCIYNVQTYYRSCKHRFDELGCYQ